MGRERSPSRAGLLALVALLLLPFASAGSNGMAMTPPLTWRSWNQWGWYINESVLLGAARGLTVRGHATPAANSP